ncbi:MAG: PA14 domain-containing protein [Bacteroidota bacterium]
MAYFFALQLTSWLTVLNLAASASLVEKRPPLSEPSIHISAHTRINKIATNGLQADYYNGRNFNHKVFSRIDPRIDFEFDKGGLPPGMNSDDFSVRWRGTLFAPVAGVYKLIVHADDGVRVWMGGKLIMDQWRWQYETVFTKNIALDAGRYYDLKVEYYNHPGFSVIKMSWQPPTEEEEESTSLLERITKRPTSVIPTKYLFPSKPKAIATKTIITKPEFNPQITPKKTEVSVVPNQAVQKVQKEVILKPNLQAASPNVPAIPKQEVFENLESGRAIILQHVLFEQSKYLLMPESYTELDKLVQTLLKNPRIQIEIAGHTDNMGDPRLNQVLSENRAKVIASYLFRHGIEESRIEAKGYGSSQPMADNTDENERAKNRRVEFRVK